MAQRGAASSSSIPNPLSLPLPSLISPAGLPITGRRNGRTTWVQHPSQRLLNSKEEQEIDKSLNYCNAYLSFVEKNSTSRTPQDSGSGAGGGSEL